MAVKLPPKWKAKREIKRVQRQIRDIPRTLCWYFLATPYYDKHFAPKQRVTDGACVDSDRMAIVVIYPQQGVLDSHIEMLRYFKDRDVACLVVSNLALSGDDRDRLLPYSWKVIERTNFGYDFGGYRDGVLYLESRLKTLQQLVLINDSSWFPLPGGADWLAQVNDLSVDFASAASSYGIPRVDLEDFMSLKWKMDVNLSEFHYCSYALALGPKVLKSPAFPKFWKSMRLSEQKSRVVRRGEMGLSRWVIKQGFSHGSTYDLLTLDAELKTCNDDEIVDLARNMVTLAEASMARVLDDVLPKLIPETGPILREELEMLIKATCARIGVSYVIPRFLYEKHGFPFLKKSPIWSDRRESDILIDFVRDLPAPMRDIMLNEAMELRKGKGPRFDRDLAREAGVFAFSPQSAPNRRLPKFFPYVRGLDDARFKYPESLDYRGLTVPISRAHVPIPVVMQLRQNDYEAPEIFALEGLLSDGDRILELGAGIGVVSGLASRMRPGVEIWSFEANRTLLDPIGRLHAANDISNVHVQNALLTHEPKEDHQTFHIHKYFPESSIKETDLSVEAVDVPVRDFGQVVSEFQPDLLLCDIEGGEAELLTQVDFGSISKIVLELHPRVIGHEKIGDIYRHILSQGFTPLIELASEQVVAFIRQDKTAQ